MQKIIARHGHSSAHAYNLLAPHYGQHAPLTARGKVQSQELNILLDKRFGIDAHQTQAATSEARRCIETALCAGFGGIAVTQVLNEVRPRQSVYSTLQYMQQGIVPFEIIAAAERVLHEPPVEEVWITGNLLISGICAVSGIKLDEPILGFGQAVAIEI